MDSIYQPLRPDREELRLLRLDPAPSLDFEVSCNLVLSSLQVRPRFEALSYCWGDPSITAAIVVNGVEHHVTTNLEEALRYLRHSTEVKILWVDALCINQNDIQERNSQVMMMKSIYSSAENVPIWLGTARDSSDHVMDFVQHLANNYPSAAPMQYRHAFLNNIYIEGQPLVARDITSSRSSMDCMTHFGNRPWWHRVWILQEVLLARSAIVHCGNRQGPLKDFFRMSEIVGDLADDEPQSQDMYRRVFQSIGALKSCLQIFTDLQSVRTGAEQFGPGNNTLVMLADGWKQEATDPRDKIYGMLGILPDTYSQVTARYDWPVEKVYSQFTLQVMATSQSLAPLGFVPPPRNHLLSLPSWVPDWSIATIRVSFKAHFMASEHLQACGNLSLSVEPVSDDVIRVSGILIGGIRTVGDVYFRHNQDGGRSPFAMQEQNQYATFTQWQHTCGLKSLSDRSKSYVGGGRLRTAFWRTICHDIAVEHSTENPRVCHPDDADFDAFMRWWNWLGSIGKPVSSSERGDANIAMLQTCISVANNEVRFIVTETGLIGTAPIDARCGDLVYVLAGGRLAYILRPKHDALRQPAFTVVGSAYVQGLMNGEATTVAWQAGGMLKEIGGLFRRLRRVNQPMGALYASHEIYLY